MGTGLMQNMSASEYQRLTVEALPPQERFDEAINDLKNAAKHIHDLLLRESELRVCVGLRKGDLECIRAKHIAEGVLGKNADEREANLTLALRADEEYREVLAGLAVDDAELGRTQASLELWRDARSIAKRRCEAWIAVHQAAGRG